LIVVALCATDRGHDYLLSRPLTKEELAVAIDVFPRHQDSLAEVVQSLFWDFGGLESSRHILVAGLTTGGRPRVERAIYDLLCAVDSASDDVIRASLDALPIDLP
jgi:hypothetical protein